MEIGRIGETRIRMSFWLLPFAALMIWLGDALTMVALLICVSLHEAAHAVLAARLGLRVRSIELLPFGGVAQIDHPIFKGPGVEFAVAAAGPVMSFLSAFILSYVDHLFTLEWVALRSIIQINTTLALFNLLPALPLDGGRMLRALLCHKMGFAKATRLASTIGVICGMILTLLGFVSLFFGIWNVTLLCCGVFLIIMAVKEGRTASFALGKSLSSAGFHLGTGAIRVRPLAIMSTAPLSSVVCKMVPGEYHVVTVLGDDLRAIGQLDEASILSALQKSGAHLEARHALKDNNPYFPL